jgi:hypothetical protein
MEESKVVITSRKYTLNLLDGAKGIALAVIAGGLTTLETSMEAVVSGSELDINWKKVAITGIIAGVAYLLKNFFTPSEEKRPIEQTNKQ